MNASSVHGQDQSGNALQHTVWRVKSQEPQIGYMGDLQHAWQFSIGGYDEQQAGNCLFWLFEEPSANRIRGSNSRHSSGEADAAALAVQRGENFAADASDAAQHVTCSGLSLMSNLSALAILQEVLTGLPTKQLQAQAAMLLLVQLQGRKPRMDRSAEAVAVAGQPVMWYWQLQQHLPLESLLAALHTE